MDSESKILTFVAGLFLAVIVLVAVVACNDPGGNSGGYYPHDTSHGYYDTHHHYHYYPKYGSGHVKVQPAPRKGNAPAVRKFGGPSYKRR
jgi:hypothetical protein